MSNKIIVQPSFQREAKRMAKHYRSFKDDYESLIQELEQDPYLGTDLGGGLRKIRRVITFNVIIAVDETEINLLYLYDKSERSSITTNEIEELLQKNGLK